MHVLSTPPAFILSQDQTLQLSLMCVFVEKTQGIYFGPSFWFYRYLVFKDQSRHPGGDLVQKKTAEIVSQRVKIVILSGFSCQYFFGRFGLYFCGFFCRRLAAFPPPRNYRTYVFFTSMSTVFYLFFRVYGDPRKRETAFYMLPQALSTENVHSVNLLF